MPTAMDYRRRGYLIRVLEGLVKASYYEGVAVIPAINFDSGGWYDSNSKKSLDRSFRVLRDGQHIPSIRDDEIDDLSNKLTIAQSRIRSMALENRRLRRNVSNLVSRCTDKDKQIDDLLDQISDCSI